MYDRDVHVIDDDDVVVYSQYHYKQTQSPALGRELSQHNGSELNVEFSGQKLKFIRRRKNRQQGALEFGTGSRPTEWRRRI